MLMQNEQATERLLTTPTSLLPPKCCSRCFNLEYLASGGVSASSRSRSSDSSSDASEAAEAAEAVDGLLEKVAAVGNTVESAANDMEEEEVDLAHLASI